ncbi:fatty acid desaturase family protein [Parasphingorhabdus cellanae]|uniref:Fatty acid desaturase n=1 Tax=Parasphingorhabdus cellanae TaxID=2806553 RepID=A0ABX7T470_9SPHN|nr:fatty acid desaturase [Parasphingorhabdus cellanae]QTD55728.1 fatty acid desaturase [Parasphingorhabdus cellanae]
MKHSLPQATDGTLLPNTVAADAPKVPAFDDNELIRTAAKVTRDLNAVRPMIYWTDLLASAVIGYGAMIAAIMIESTGLAILAGIISVLALYRAGSFIHELTHIRRGSMPGFHFTWNALIGVPLLLPSFMYEGVHNLHHMRKRYGTVEDPEYLPLALMKPYTVPLFVLVSALAPIGLFIRYALLAPLSMVIPPLRKLVVERYSGLVINPEFRRRSPEGEFKRQWYAQEIAASIWAIVLLTAVATGFLPMKAFLIAVAIAAGSVVLNQIRTLVAHLWENDGEVMSVTEQYLDSVNVPPPGLLPALWAPVGLRYHALHHLLPGVPYHALGEAHRRIAEALPKGSTYYRANHTSLFGLVAGLVRGSAGQASSTQSGTTS